MKKISVIVPIFNSEQFINRCVESILNQTYKNLEIILVDDGSTDDSGKICDQYALTDSRITVIHKINEGVSKARNMGIDASKGDLISFVDADDFLDVNMYEELINHLNENPADICCMAKIYMNNDVYTLIQEKLSDIESQSAIMRLLKFKFPTSLWTSIYDSKLIKGFYLNEEIHFWEDFEYQFRILSAAKSCAIYQKPLYHYSINYESANHKGINDKVFSCLKVSDLIIENSKEMPLEIRKLAVGLELKFLCAVFNSMLTSKMVDKKYYIQIKTYAKEKIKKISVYKCNSKKEKIILYGCALAPKYFRFLYKLMQAVRRVLKR